MGKTTKKRVPAAPKKVGAKKVAVAPKPVIAEAPLKKVGPKKIGPKKHRLTPATPPAPPLAVGAAPAVLDRLWAVVHDRRGTDPSVSHSARLLGRGTAKVAQKFGEEAVECVIEAIRGNRSALVTESADVLYHLVVMWVNAGIRSDEVWAELQRREGVSGVAEKAARVRALPQERGVETTKIP